MSRAHGPAVLVWFRQDLRLSDNPAVAAAVARRAPLIPVFVWAPEEEGDWPPGAASRWWLGRSLEALRTELEKRGSRLILRRGPTAETLDRLVAESGATAVFWNRRYEPAAAARDVAIELNLARRGVGAAHFNGSLLFDPATLRTLSGRPFRVFTPFWRACLDKPVEAAVPDAPERLPAPKAWPSSLEIGDLRLESPGGRASGFRDVWQPGEAGARRQLRRFLGEGLAGYDGRRDRPGVAGTSRLSPHLHFGEISPGQVWRAVAERMSEAPAACQAYLRQLGWREFAHHLLHHYPESPGKALRRGFKAFPWRTDPEAFEAWSEGRTGYPLVDAGMRELRRTGWMHNRVRMVAASFLVKHLLIGWQRGAAWFWDTLVDADLANNTLGWQWVAGCGADAAPYFRIFNPSVQAGKFDPQGEYLRRWVPELEAGGDYPRPIVDHSRARTRALGALENVRKR